MQVEIRRWRKEDIQSLARHANSQAIAGNLRDGFPIPYTEKDAEAFIRACIAADDESECFRAIEVDGEAAGSIGLLRKDNIHAHTAELGYWLGEAFHGKGVVTQATRLLCAHGFDHMNLVRIFALPFAYNTASCRVLEKAGFEREGILRKNAYKNGRHIDCALYALVR